MTLFGIKWCFLAHFWPKRCISEGTCRKTPLFEVRKKNFPKIEGFRPIFADFHRKSGLRELKTRISQKFIQIQVFWARNLIFYYVEPLWGLFKRYFGFLVFWPISPIFGPSKPHFCVFWPIFVIFWRLRTKKWVKLAKNPKIQSNVCTTLREVQHTKKLGS